MSFEEFEEEARRSSGVSAKFERVGDTVVGTVVDANKVQDREFGTGEPKYYSDGNPVMIWVIALDVDGADQPVNVWARGQMLAAIRHAVEGKKFGPGGKLAVRFDSEEPSGKGNPQKIYRAQYEPPSGADMFAAEAAAQPAPAPVPAAQPVDHNDLF